MYTCFTTGVDADSDDTVVRTLTGDYACVNRNHGRKVYLKVKAHPADVNVHLYYWDERDGIDWRGWWFGNKLGGNWVWAHSKETTLEPPSIGWRVPWGGPLKITLIILPTSTLRTEVPTTV